MEVTVLKDLLIQAGQTDTFYEGRVPVNLWRALNRRANASLFDFVEESFVLSNGRPRPADIRIFDRAGTK